MPDPIAIYGGTPKPRPILFVGNHSGAGALDLPLLVHELHLRGYVARALAHPAAWFSPLGAAIERFGGVKATPYSAYRLLKAGGRVLSFHTPQRFRRSNFKVLTEVGNTCFLTLVVNGAVKQTS